MKGRRERIISLRKQQPDWTLDEIGGNVGLSRERVRQILKSEGMETRGIWERKYQKSQREYLYQFNKYLSAGSSF